MQPYVVRMTDSIVPCKEKGRDGTGGPENPWEKEGPATPLATE